MQYSENFFSCKILKILQRKKMIFLIYLHKPYIVGLVEAVLTSTHNVCFGSEIRILGIPLQTPFFLYKSGSAGIYISRSCFPDDVSNYRFHFTLSGVTCVYVSICHVRFKNKYFVCFW